MVQVGGLAPELRGWVDQSYGCAERTRKSGRWPAGWSGRAGRRITDGRRAAGEADRLDDPDQYRADPVRRAGAAVPELGGAAVLFGLGSLVGVLGRAAKAVPGVVGDLVVARGGRRVRREVLAAGFALHDRPGDRPRAARTRRHRGAA